MGGRGRGKSSSLSSQWVVFNEASLRRMLVKSPLRRTGCMSARMQPLLSWLSLKKKGAVSSVLDAHGQSGLFLTRGWSRVLRRQEALQLGPSDVSLPVAFTVRCTRFYLLLLGRAPSQEKANSINSVMAYATENCFSFLFLNFFFKQNEGTVLNCCWMGK